MEKTRYKPYVVSKKYDELGREFYYCHMKNYPYIPVFGSIGDEKKAKRVCKMMNEVHGYG